MSTGTKPRVLIVHYSLTGQSARVTHAMALALRERGCEAEEAAIEFTDERWVPKLAKFPMTHPIPQIASILPAQLRHKTGEIGIPAAAQGGDYDLVLLASPPGGFRRACRSAPIWSRPRPGRCWTARRSHACRSPAATTASTSGK